MKKWRLLLLLLPLVAVALYMRSLASWRPNMVFKAKTRVVQFVFSDDGKTLLVIQADSHFNSLTFTPVIVTALDTQHEFVPRWQRKAIPFNGQSPQFFDHDSRLLLNDTIISMLDSETGKQLKDCQLIGISTVSPNGKWFAHNILGGEGLVDVYLMDAKRPIGVDMSSGKKLGQRGRSAMKFSFSPDGRILVVGVGDRNGACLEFYDSKTWKLVRTWTDLKHNFPKDFPWYTTLRWSRDGRYLLSCYFADYKPKTSLWRVSDGQRLAISTSKNAPPELRADGRPIGFSDEGHVFLRKNHSLDSWGESLLYIPREAITAATLSPDGSYLVAGTQSGKVYWKRLK